MLVSRVDMNIPITTIASGTTHFVFCAARARPWRGPRRRTPGAAAQALWGESRFGELSAGTLLIAGDRGATATPPPALAPRLVSPSRLFPAVAGRCLPREDHS